MNREFDYSKLISKSASERDPAQLLEVLRNTDYLVDMLNTVAKHSSINTVYTNGLDIYEGKKSLPAIAIDCTPTLKQPLIEQLNTKFVPDYAELSDVTDGLKGRTILLSTQRMKFNVSSWAEIKDWRSAICLNV